MAKLSFKGLEVYEQRMSALGKDAQTVAEKAVYEGAKIVADAVKKNLEGLKSTTQTEAMHAYQAQTPTNITHEAKQGLVKSFGISPVRNDKGYINVKIGFDGYNTVKTHKYPKGQPNNMIARSCESGSSSMNKQPFMRTAVDASKNEAEKKMAEILAAEINKKLEG